ncbi:MAG: phosphate/phosphite/phosphonate ABC transporter substrate-binding protein [Rhodocyclaceae bacterium]|nr:phosphate/phosphite/phosphonate ABC transporter substrate-binding protein [Rhodocyclaceae bacterium]
MSPMALCRWLTVACALLLSACGDNRGTQSYQPQYGTRPMADASSRRECLFGIHPLHNPARLFQVYGPIMDRLNASIPEAHFSLEASRNYEEFDKKLYARHFDLALPNPYQTVTALGHGYRVFGKMGDDDQFRGIILVRKDSPVRKVSDLKGKALSFPAATALAATMMPQRFLHEHGLPIRDYQPLYVGSQESSIMNVFLGTTAAGATWPPPWQAFVKDHPENAAQLKIMWTTESLRNNGLVVRDDFPPQLLQKVEHVLFTLQDSEAGRAILASLPLSRFEAANEETYRPVRDYVAHFSRTVRPLEAP